MTEPGGADPEDDLAPDAQPGDELRDPEEPEFPEPIVFRVARREPQKAVLAFGVVSMVAVFVAMVPTALTLDVLHVGQPGRQRAMEAMLGACALAGVAGGLRALRPRVSCSDPACPGVPGPRDEACPGCGQRIAGTIAHPDDRLAAEEAVRAGAFWTDASDGGVTGLRR